MTRSSRSPLPRLAALLVDLLPRLVALLVELLPRLAALRVRAVRCWLARQRVRQAARSKFPPALRLRS